MESFSKYIHVVFLKVNIEGLKRMYEIWVWEKLLHRNVLWRFGPFRSINIDEKLPNLQSTFPCNNQFLKFCDGLTVNIEGLGSGGSPKTNCDIEMYFGCLSIFIEQIRFYIQTNSPLKASKSPNCELFWMFVLWRFPKAQRLIFTMVFENARYLPWFSKTHSFLCM